MIDRIRREPVLVTSLVAAVMYLLTEFGVTVTDGQQAAILGVVGAILAFVARSQVTPTTPADKGENGSDPGSRPPVL